MVQVVHEGGVYANGQVVIQPLPTAIYGDDAQRTIPLRRWEAVLTDGELEEQCAKELQKVHTAPCMHSQGARYSSCCTLDCTNADIRRTPAYIHVLLLQF